MKAIKNLKKGDFFTLREHPFPTENMVWVKGGYVSKGWYCCYKFNDVNHCKLFRGIQMVFDDEHFIF